MKVSGRGFASTPLSARSILQQKAARLNRIGKMIDPLIDQNSHEFCMIDWYPNT